MDVVNFKRLAFKGEDNDFVISGIILNLDSILISHQALQWMEGKMISLVTRVMRI